MSVEIPASCDAHLEDLSQLFPMQTREMRTLLGTRKQLVRDQSSHVLRVQKTLEDANIKLDSVLTDVMGKSGRAMVEALIAGDQTCPPCRSAGQGVS
jgi:hypothetical protein